MPDAWISVKDRLPEPLKTVLVVSSRGEVCMAHMDTTVGFYGYDPNDGEFGPFPHITHWRPLPDPPKEGE